jgi:hypothetical protein
MKQILYFYKLLPEEWRRKAHFIFDNLWKKKTAILSTNPDAAMGFMEANFNDARINQLFALVPDNDKKIMFASQGVIDLTDKGLHADSFISKGLILKNHGIRGINITDMLTTGDIEQPLLESAGKKSEEQLKIFNWWADNYDKIAFLVLSEQIAEPEKIEAEIKERAKSRLKPYVLINFAGTLEEARKLIDIITDMKTQKKLNYISIVPILKERGFKTCANIRIDF